MKRKDYFKGVRFVLLGFTVLGILSFTENDGMGLGWKIAVPTFFFGILAGVIIYGFVKYKK